MNYTYFILALAIILIIFENWVYRTISFGAVFIIFYSEYQEEINAKNATNTQKFIQNLNNNNQHKQGINNKSVVYYQKVPLRNIFGPNIDGILQQILHFLVRDNMYLMIKDLVFEPDALCKNVQLDLWEGIRVFKDRLDKINLAKFLSTDVVIALTNHLEKIRTAQTVVAGSEKYAESILSLESYSTENEIEFLRKIVDIVMSILSVNYRRSPLKDFSREILVKQIIYIINSVTDPSFINSSIIAYIESQKQAEKYTTEYLIRKNLKKKHPTNKIKFIRSKIIEKLTELTTEQNLSNSKCHFLNDKVNNDIEKLIESKNKCEELINENFKPDETQNTQNLVRILEEPESLEYFTQFLETIASRDLVGFWKAVEELQFFKNDLQEFNKKIGTIYENFVDKPSSEIKFENDFLIQIKEKFSDKNASAVYLLLYELQQKIVQTLSKKYYELFLYSDYCKEMIKSMRTEHPKIIAPIEKQVQFFKIEPNFFSTSEAIFELKSNANDDNNNNNLVQSKNCFSDSTDSVSIGDHLNFARRRLDQINRKLEEKQKASEKENDETFSNQIQKLEEEKSFRTSQLKKTNSWLSNLGKWRVNVENIVVGYFVPQFELKIFIANDKNAEESWTIFRRSSEFKNLHRKLLQMNKNLDSFPTMPLHFQKANKFTLERVKQEMQAYLNLILTDENVSSSEAVFSFFNNTVYGNFTCQSAIPKDPQFDEDILADEVDFFKLKTKHSKDVKRQTDSSDEESSPEEDSTTEIDSLKDTKTESIFALLDEIFGKKIARTFLLRALKTFHFDLSSKIEEVINWYLSEEMAYSYLTTFLKTVWPGGQLIEAGAALTDEENEENLKKAEELLCEMLPKSLFFVTFSIRKPKKGTTKVFNVLQSQALNKQLVFEILKLVVVELFPEFKSELENFGKENKA